MKEPSEENIGALPHSQSQPNDVANLLKDIRQKLTFLERKIDTLLNQSSERPSFQRRNFSRPGGSFNKFRHRDRESRSGEPREGGFSDSEPRSFERPAHGRDREFGAKKKFYERIPGKFKKRTHHKH